MPNRIEPLIRHLRTVLRPPESDGQLLAQFIEQKCTSDRARFAQY